MLGVEEPLGSLFLPTRFWVGDEPAEVMTAPAGEAPLGVPAFPFSLTIFRQETNLSSNAPTFLSKSPTMLSADNRADGVNWALGEDLAEAGGVIVTTDDDSSISWSSRILFESYKNA